MRQTLLPLILICSFFYSFSQEIPILKHSDSSQLKLANLRVDTRIVDNYAVTVYDMSFYNGLNQTLEGELVFPLGEGQSVSGFAMEVNGELREAVIVEKELARMAFENTVRQSIDPGLLEKTEGDNYKARVYPILPRNYKRVVVTYEQELFTIGDFRTYELPLQFGEVLDSLSITIDVFGEETTPVFVDKETKDELVFEKAKNKYTAQFQRDNYRSTTSMVINIPNKTKSQKVLTNNNYFYIYQGLEPNARLKEKPKKITILWDASFSSQYKKVDTELELIGSYAKYLKNVEIEVLSFSDKIDQKRNFNIVNGDWSALRDFLLDIEYDGGTSLDIFRDFKIASDEILMFSDGLINLGELNHRFKIPIYTINSSVSANHKILDGISTKSGGRYVNLLRYSVTDATNALKEEVFQFLGIKDNKNTREVYPPKNTNVTSDFSVSGKFLKNTTIQLLFGYNNKVVKKVDVDIKKSKNKKIVAKLWAKQKLKSLYGNKDRNKKEIIALAKKHAMVTDYTSMLILDRIEDYVRYRIEPPKELRKEYKERLKDLEDEEADRLEELKERRDELNESYEDLLKWYNTSYPKGGAEICKKSWKRVSAKAN